MGTRFVGSSWLAPPPPPARRTHGKQTGGDAEGDGLLPRGRARPDWHLVGRGAAAAGVCDVRFVVAGAGGGRVVHHQQRTTRRLPLGKPGLAAQARACLSSSGRPRAPRASGAVAPTHTHPHSQPDSQPRHAPCHPRAGRRGAVCSKHAARCVTAAPRSAAVRAEPPPAEPGRGVASRAGARRGSTQLIVPALPCPARPGPASPCVPLPRALMAASAASQYRPAPRDEHAGPAEPAASRRTATRTGSTARPWTASVPRVCVCSVCSAVFGNVRLKARHCECECESAVVAPQKPRKPAVCLAAPKACFIAELTILPRVCAVQKFRPRASCLVDA